MRKRSSKQAKDIDRLAKGIVDQATSEPSEEPAGEAPSLSTIARILGRLGGLKGGPARAASLTPEKRRAIAKKAAKKRWARKA